MSGASGVLFNLRLAQFDAFLKENCPDIWKKYGTGIRGSNILLKYYRLRSIPLEYESDNEILNAKIRTLAFIYRSTMIGLLVIFAGIIIELWG